MVSEWRCECWALCLWHVGRPSLANGGKTLIFSPWLLPSRNHQNRTIFVWRTLLDCRWTCWKNYQVMWIRRGVKFSWKLSQMSFEKRKSRGRFFLFKLGLINSMSDVHAASHSWSLQKKAATKSGGHEDKRDQSNYDRRPESRTKSGLGSICPTIWVIQAFLDCVSACFNALYPSA